MSIKSILTTSLLITFIPISAMSAIYNYQGIMQIIKTSGGACEKLENKSYPVTLIFNRLPNGSINGYFLAEGITQGKVDGNYTSTLLVTYPYHDAARSSGHVISFFEKEGKLKAILHDRHIESDINECNFDHAEMTLAKAPIEEPEKKLAYLGSRFEAHLTRSQAMELRRNGDLYGAVLSYEKAVSLSDKVYPVGNAMRDSFVAALAGSYMKADMTKEFSALYNQRFAKLSDEATKVIFNEYKLQSLRKSGRKALLNDDYDAALDFFSKANELKPQDAISIAGVMASFLKSERYEEAIKFLEKTEKNLENQGDRREIREAIALIMLKQSSVLERKGKSDAAMKLLERAELLDPASVSYPVAIARLRHKISGNLVEAEAIIEKLNKKYTDDSSKKMFAAAILRMRLVDMMLKKIKGASN